MKRKPFYCVVSGICAMAMISAMSAQGAVLQKLRGHVPAVSAGLQSVGNLPATNHLHLAISLPLRNRESLTNLLHEVYDPRSTNYRRYLTTKEFTERFGPTEKDVQAVAAFARANGFTVTKTHSNRVIVDVEASVADVEKAFRLKMRTYKHPSARRTFFAPDAEPLLELAVPLAHISGLDNASPPQPRVHVEPQGKPSGASPNFGSGVFGSYAGGDFRAAYVPDTTLTGAGQVIGLVQFDGYNLSDITNYEANYGMTNIPLTNVFLDGYDGTPGANQLETALDIEMSVVMAPGLAGVIIYDAGPSGNWHDVLNQMANDNIARQLSCSWFIPNGPADPVADGIFQQMALQGQSFFDASGDLDAYSGLIPFPSDNPYITQVGGTRLTTTGPLGSRVSENAWNRHNGVGSGGGISTQYSIPDYQTNISMANNQGSTTMRNIPDVALIAESVDVFVNGGEIAVGGTSCSAPLWAGFAALVNQQAAALGRPPLGFANPAFTLIGTNTNNYALCFNDITAGNNTNSSSPTLFFATNSYDLCTGWGTPTGQKLINALAYPEPLVILPSQGFASAGRAGGPFDITSQGLTLTNTGPGGINWTLTNTAPWLNVSPTSGSLAPGGPAATVVVSLNAAASNLAIGSYTTSIRFSNLNDNFSTSAQFSLNILTPPAITAQPSNQAVLDGQTAVFSATAAGDPLLTYQWRLNGTNLTDGGKISGAATNILTINNASTNDTGIYTLVVTNFAGSTVSSNAMLSLTPSAPVVMQQPVGQTNYVGLSAQFSVAAVGTKPFIYQWTLNGTNITGATNASLVLTNLQLSESGNCAVTVSNSVSATVSSNAALTVNADPSCATHPSGLVSWWQAEGNTFDSVGGNNGTPIGNVNYGPGEIGLAFVFAGDDSCVDVGNPTSLQTQSFSIEAWIQRAADAFTNGADVLVFAGGSGGYGFGMTSDGRLFLADIDFSNVTIDNGVGDTNWHHIAVTTDGSNVVFYIDGTSYPAGVYSPGFTFDSDFAIGARGDNNDGGGRAGFDGAIDELAFYDRPLSAPEVQLIYVAGTGGKCPIPPTIVTQPTNQTRDVGDTVELSLAVSGSQPLVYQWIYNGTNIVSGATNATLTLPNIQLSDTGTYFVNITNAYGVTNSTNVTLTVLSHPPVIISQPANAAAYAGSSAGFTVAATGSPPLSYQWTFNGTNISGATNAMLTLASVQTNQLGNYAVLITNAFGSAQSSNAGLFIVPMVSCDPPPPSMVGWWKGEGNALDAAGTNNGELFSGVAYGPGEVGQAFVFPGSGSVIELGNPPELQLQDFTMEMWIQRSAGAIVNNGPGELMFSGGSGGYGFGLTSDGRLFLTQIDVGNVTITNGVGDTNWHHVAVTKAGSEVVFYIDGAAYPAGSPYDPGFAFNIGAAIGARADDQTSGFYGAIDEVAIYNRALAAPEIQAIYQISANGKCPPPVAIVMQPVSQRLTTNCNANFSVVGAGESPLTYQWWKGGVALAGQTNSSLAIDTTQLTNFGTYFVVVDNALGVFVASSNVVLSLDHAPVAGTNTVQRFASGGVKFPVSVLLTNTSDPDGDPVTLIVGTNTSAGGTVLVQGNSVFYTPPAGYTNSDSFTYLVSDGFCGGMATGFVMVQVQPDSTLSGTYRIREISGGSIRLSFNGGIPNRAYRIQYTDSLVNLNWHDLTTQTNDGFGSFQFNDSSPTNTPARYYRAISP